MAITFEKSRKICATCVYWQGERNLVFNYSAVRLESTAHGICGNPKGRFRINQSCTSNCSQYLLWSLIR